MRQVKLSFFQGVPFVVDDCTAGFGEGAISDFECLGDPDSH